MPSININAAKADELIASLIKNWKKNPNGNMVIRREPSGNI
jgi:hypothetical protein